MSAFLQRFKEEQRAQGKANNARAVSVSALRSVGLALAMLLLATSASADYSQAAQAAEQGQTYQALEHPRDPWEGWNRKVFSFNETVDTYTAKPAAQAYRKVTPGFFRRSVGNFFNNLRDLRSGVNNILQWRWGDAGHNLGRFGLNTTLGVAGLFDVATSAELDKRDSDFGITLARWGAPQGPYMMLPLMGPSTVRDTVGMFPDDYLALRRYVDHDLTSWTVLGLYVLDVRATVLDYEAAITGDRYVFIRDFYLSSRDRLAGQSDAEADFEFGDDLDEDWDDAW